MNQNLCVTDVGEALGLYGRKVFSLSLILTLDFQHTWKGARMNNDMTVALGRQIRIERFLRGFSQEQLAETAGLHRTFIGVVERGEKHITVANCSKIAIALDIRLSELIRMAEETLTHSPISCENSPQG